MARILENFGLFLANVIIKNSETNDYLVIRIIMYILLVFASFIFNEYLIENEIFYDVNNTFELDEEQNNGQSDNNYYLWLNIIYYL